MSSPEAAILADFLLAPAALREVLTLQQFADIFPKSLRTNLAIKELYQELQRLRHQDLNAVQKNIAAELSASKSLKRQSARARQGYDHVAVAGLDPVKPLLYSYLYFLQLSGLSGDRNPHTLRSIEPSIQEACESVTLQNAGLEEELQNVLARVRDTVGELSDLRYGRFLQHSSGESISDELLVTVRRLQSACSSAPSI
ncbi:Cnl2/NKP2 family protein-domain-containing protein [Dendryphion nanum]|uniref:Cnl2/NKP2 family protein-domain-containing protein n=1 Tax=Dendryphion nanum TaxID=256645 RepID=A0A9P9IK51_9PLEO|nr:Cnl2/NKP2 family protein-domain-containing protein [Dendryphion nanum]